MRRRDFIKGISVWPALPLSARAQQQKGPVRLALLPVGSPSNTYDRSLVEAFQEGLRHVGLVENQNIVLDVIWSGNDPDHAVTEALRRGAELLITSGSSTSVVAKRSCL